MGPNGISCQKPQRFGVDQGEKVGKKHEFRHNLDGFNLISSCKTSQVKLKMRLNQKEFMILSDCGSLQLSRPAKIRIGGFKNGDLPTTHTWGLAIINWV